MARYSDTKLAQIKMEARKMFCDPSVRYNLAKIAKVLNIAPNHVGKWAKEEDWADIRKRIDDGIKARLTQEGIEDGVLNIKQIKVMQEDLIKEGKKRYCFTKDSAYRAAASLETLIMKKRAIKANPDKALSILDVLTDDTENTEG